MSGVGLLAGRYRLLDPLGQGGMAVVQLAEDVQLGRMVAVKLLADTVSGDDPVRRRFLREARAAAGIAHPNVVRVYDAGEDGGRPYFVMEHVEGETLVELVRREGRVAPERAVDLGVQACAGLQAAHDAGLVHRDVKPQNLLLRADGVLKVVDFGIARAQEGTQLTAAGTMLGSVAYVAPEQLAGEEVGPPADVYGLGAVLYELLAGRPPRTASTFAELVPGAPVRPLRELVRGVPPALERIVTRCLDPDPAARPQSAAELAQELESVRVEAPTEPLAPSRGAHRRPRRLPLLLTALALALVALGVALAVGLGGGDPGGERAQRNRPVTPVPHSDDPAQQARNLSAWLRAAAAGGR